MSAAAHEHAPVSYKAYWIAWLVLLGVTLAMIYSDNRLVLYGGIATKAFVIAAWFMHLKHEKPMLYLSVIAGFVFAVFLFFLISFDARVA